MNCGIYSITNKVNNKKYIGQSINLQKRKQGHLRMLKKNIHHNKHLQNAFNKYGEENFIFSILTRCQKKDLDKKEEYFISLFDTTNRKKGYNILESATQNPMELDEIRNRPFTKSHKQKISKALTLNLPDPIVLYKKWQDGYTLKEIAEQYDCSDTCIGNRIKSAGFVIDGQNRGKRKHDWVPIARVSKSGFQSYNQKRVYQLSFDGKIIKQSVDKKLLQDLADMLNSGASIEDIDNEFFNRKFVFSIRKKIHNAVKQGYIWVYFYKQNGKEHEYSSTNLFLLFDKIKQKGLPWDNTFYPNILKKDRQKVLDKYPAGIFYVTKQNKKGVNQGFLWVYNYQKKTITSTDINKLKNKVLSKGLPWRMIE